MSPNHNIHPFPQVKLIKIGKIIEIIMINEQMFIECQIFKSNFDIHYHAFEINETSQNVLINTSEIYHYHPLSVSRNLKVGDLRIFVRPHCLISNVL